MLDGGLPKVGGPWFGRGKVLFYGSTLYYHVYFPMIEGPHEPEGLLHEAPRLYGCMLSLKHQRQMRGAQSWSELTGLNLLLLNSNNLDGTLPPQWSTLTGLAVLQIHNKLDSTMPQAASLQASHTTRCIFDMEYSQGWPHPCVLQIVGLAPRIPENHVPCVAARNQPPASGICLLQQTVWEICMHECMHAHERMQTVATVHCMHASA
eukprot:365058-Chlamydomonas_euryale.AAC.1